jgi:ankyrin repeat protein
MENALPVPVMSMARSAMAPPASKPIAKKRGGETELHQAAMAGDHHQLASLLRQDSHVVRRSTILTLPGRDVSLDVNAQDELGRTALHWAVALDDVECVKMLLEGQQNRSQPSGQGWKNPVTRSCY